MERLAIIADNLIGANDAGVQFRKFGFSTRVVLDYEELAGECAGVDVLSVNTNSRTIAADAAYERVGQAGKMLLALGFKRFYKKIDSTLRGNIAEEVRAMMDSLQIRLAIIAPAYPAHGRLVENGYLQIIQAWGENSTPVPICFIPSVIKPAPSTPVAVLSLNEVRQGEKNLVKKITELHSAGINMIAVDAVTDEDLRTIAIAINQLAVPCLSVGSAGLAANLPIAWKVVNQEHLRVRQGTMLIAGTLNHVTAKQIASALEYPGTELIEIRSDMIYEGRVEEEMTRVMDCIAAVLLAGRIPVLVIDTLLRERNDAESLSISGQVQKYGSAVTALLGQIAKETVERFSLRNLVISGGGTATSICHTLGISIIDLDRELLPGTPVGKAGDGKCSGLYLVTKAGGFGKRNSLRRVLELL